MKKNNNNNNKKGSCVAQKMIIMKQWFDNNINKDEFVDHIMDNWFWVLW